MNKNFYFLIFILILTLSCEIKNPFKNSDITDNSGPIVVLCIDDGLEETYQVVLPILNKFHYPATFGIITRNVNVNEGSVTWAQLDTLANIYHWEIASHSVSHPHLDLLSDEDFLYQLVESKNVLEYHNFKVDTFIVPYGAMTLEQLELARTIYKNIRFAHDNYNVSPLLRYKLWAFELDESTTLDKIKNRINLAIVRKEKVLIFFFHHVREEEEGFFDITFEKLNKTLSLIKENNLKVMTLNKALDSILKDKDYQK